MDNKITPLMELYEKADSIKLSKLPKNVDLGGLYSSYKSLLEGVIDPMITSEHDTETKSRLIEILELEVSNLNPIIAYWTIQHPFGNKWESKGKFLYYFDTIKMKLAGLVSYLTGNHY